MATPLYARDVRDTCEQARNVQIRVVAKAAQRLCVGHVADEAVAHCNRAAEIRQRRVREQPVILFRSHNCDADDIKSTQGRIAHAPDTMTANEHAMRLSEASCAAQVTVVLPTGNAKPDGGEHVTLT